MTARASAWDIADCCPSVRVDGGGEGLDGGRNGLAGLEGLAATAAGAVDEVVIAGFWRVCVGVDAVASDEAEVRPISVSKMLKDGELGLVDTSRNCPSSLTTSLVCFKGVYASVSSSKLEESCRMDGYISWCRERYPENN